jgi:predicted PhzF superfamily epimerase YddE/YHI9
MTQPLFIIDAFTDRPMTGNPAAVCPLESWLPVNVMQSIASEMNLSETVFFAPRPGGADSGSSRDFDVRWFTPTKEVDLIGHATLAAGYLVLTRLDPSLETVRFFSPTAELSVRRDCGMLQMSMPALIPAPVEEPVGLAAALGAKPSAVLASKHYLALFDSADDIAGLRPDFAELAELPLPAVIVTAKADGDFDFVSRFFAPANGVPEDSVSGVAHCCLAPYWSERLGRATLTGRQLSMRGGTVHCEYSGNRVTLGGTAAIFLEGSLSL